MEDDPVLLDERRGMEAQKATEIRRLSARYEAEQADLRRRQIELETALAAAPAATWNEAAAKARYLLTLFAETSPGQDPRRQALIAGVLEDFERMAERGGS